MILHNQLRYEKMAEIVSRVGKIAQFNGSFCGVMCANYALADASFTKFRPPIIQ